VASLVFPILAAYSLFYSLLVTEVTPSDQAEGIPIPSLGDRVSVYGVWVQDTEFVDLGFGGWNEIHPVRYMEINGVGYGNRDYHGDLFQGVWGPSRLILKDSANPYRMANGTVGEVIFNEEDGDYHVHIKVDNGSVALLKPSIFATSFPLYSFFKILAPIPVLVIISYVLTSILKPERTWLGRRFPRRKKLP